MQLWFIILYNGSISIFKESKGRDEIKKYSKIPRIVQCPVG